jgi:hypothetical protein
MDLGMFNSGEKGFWPWLIGPPVVLIAILLPVSLFSMHIKRDCDERQAILRQIPEMNLHVSLARETLKHFIFRPDGDGLAVADGAAEVSQRIYRAAQKHGFAIRSLTADKNEATGKTGLTALTVSVQGDGALSDIVAMFDDLYAPEQLCAVSTVHLKEPRTGPDKLSYSADIVFQCYVASISNDN